MKKFIKMQSHTGLHGSRPILSGSRLLWQQATGELAKSLSEKRLTLTKMRKFTFWNEFLN